MRLASLMLLGGLARAWVPASRRLSAGPNAAAAARRRRSRLRRQSLAELPGLIDLGAFDRPALEAYVTEELKAPKFRAKQIHEWIYDKGVHDFDAMSNLPKKFRDDLKARGATVGGTIAKLRVEQVSQRDGTIKRAYEFRDGSVVESVLMPYEDGRRTACISSQAGCGMGCTFCATGQMGLTRHLTAAEIFEQAARFSRGAERPGRAAATDAARSAIMPVNDRYDLETLLGAVRDYQAATRRRVTFEWAAIAGENDDVDAARTLGALLKKHGIRDAHVNVIPLNPTKGYGGKRAKNGAVDRFCKTLETEFGVSATPRVRRGHRHRRGLRPADDVRARGRERGRGVLTTGETW
ncbi:hypothetical protein JL721_9123 [Aureococcus anophagefferens]|nr:hypothetical protein JL721_9123 [Aureococcus anophagefferens]